MSRPKAEGISGLMREGSEDLVCGEHWTDVTNSYVYQKVALDEIQ